MNVKYQNASVNAVKQVNDTACKCKQSTFIIKYLFSQSKETCRLANNVPTYLFMHMFSVSIMLNKKSSEYHNHKPQHTYDAVRKKKDRK